MNCGNSHDLKGNVITGTPANGGLLLRRRKRATAEKPQVTGKHIISLPISQPEHRERMLPLAMQRHRHSRALQLRVIWK